jgi:polyhydroxyalkanoate synthesis regulator phasin
MAKRKNIMTGFLEDIIDDTKDFVDDILDRAKDVESDLKDAVQDVTDDEKESVPTSEVAALHVALADLTAKVNQLAELQLAGAKA